MSHLLSKDERLEIVGTYRKLLRCTRDTLSSEDIQKIKEYTNKAIDKNGYLKDIYGLNILNRTLHTALILADEMSLKRHTILAVLLFQLVVQDCCTVQEIRKSFDEETAGIIERLIKTYKLYEKNPVIKNENFRKLLVSFAEDVRVILIIIAERLFLMRISKQITNEKYREQIAIEASYLYAPISHKLGLYKIKSELEDLSLKIHDRQTYDFIKQKINETKRSRDQYISEFIAPIKKKLTELGLNFDIKGRTKSIHSINNKLRKQKTSFENIYDLFAIRIVLDTPLEKEKAECWQVYSVITDMYQPNPNRMKDWLSLPKTNGYESLHTTVMGPGGRWVEVQIRSQRMDEIAEKGLAAHWKYKGLKSESSSDELMNHIRQVLEQNEASDIELISDFQTNLSEDEIFVFTPRGDLFRLPYNASVLDFAFAIHTKVGSQCVSAKVNGKNVPIKHKLKNGDQVDIQTSSNQSPKQAWLNYAVTSKARVKIKQSLKEQSAKQVDFAKELLQRRFKNRKIEEDEAKLMRLIKKMGYKTVTDFYVDIADDHLDINTVIDHYLEYEKKEAELAEHSERSAENFSTLTPIEEISQKEDVLVIGNDLTGVDYTLAKCCNPIYGDEIFGFISSRGIKIHRKTCPNANAMHAKRGYRIVQTRWSGKPKADYPVAFRVVGHDDIGIVTNITSMISKEKDATLRSISVDSVDGLFQGTITVLLKNNEAATQLIEKIKAIKGVKSVSRY